MKNYQSIRIRLVDHNEYVDLYANIPRRDEKGFVKGYVDGYVVSIIMPIMMETLLTEGYSTNDIFRYREILKNKFKNREI